MSQIIMMGYEDLSLQNAFHQPLTGMVAGTYQLKDSPLPQHKHKTVAYQSIILSGGANSHLCIVMVVMTTELLKPVISQKKHDVPCIMKCMIYS